MAKSWFNGFSSSFSDINWYRSMNKATVFSPYEEDAEFYNIQLTEMRDTLGDEGVGYTVANTMSTPMLVNDWRDPHRTLLVIAAPEKPFDSAEASAIFDFVTKICNV